jgi:hypothetical protein
MLHSPLPCMLVHDWLVAIAGQCDPHRLFLVQHYQMDIRIEYYTH